MRSSANGKNAACIAAARLALARKPVAIERGFMTVASLASGLPQHPSLNAQAINRRINCFGMPWAKS